MSGPGGDIFMPALLDRLSDKGSGAMGLNAFRATVMRDLTWLLNCTNLDRQLPLEKYPLAKFSVLNFGITPLAGACFTASDLRAVAHGIQRTIAYFEPRILEKTLKVSVAPSTEQKHNQALFRIEASYWFEPYPIDMVLRALWDMETGGVNLREER
jgi:type VI secretion system protein ImpF